MDKNKLGTVFMITVLALAGIGISYAGFTDTLDVYGTVSTARVQFEDFDYAGTWVYKVFDEEPNEYGSEIVVTDDPTYSVDPEDGFLVAYGKARPGESGESHDVYFEFDNLFPQIPFEASLSFTVESIPVKINELEWDYDIDSENAHLEDLINNGIFATMKDQDDNVIVNGSQIHPGDVITLTVHMTIPQDNKYQNLSGSGWLDLGIVQWTDDCDEEQDIFDIALTKTVDNNNPFYGELFTYTITAENLGPDDASNVMVEDILPDELKLDSYHASKGSYDPLTGEWQIGNLNADELVTLEITSSIQDFPETEQTQLALLIDGSGSISEEDWDIMLEGIAFAITNGYIPINGQVELTVIQFGGETDIDGRIWAQVELDGPTVLDETNYNSVASDILAIEQLGGGTAMSCAFRLAADVLSGDPNEYLVGTSEEGMASPNHGWSRQVVNLITDGQPNVMYNHTDRYGGYWAGLEGDEYDLGKENTTDALSYFFSIVDMNEEDGDEIDAEAIGTETDIEWLKEFIVWPQPGYDDWPPTGPGWVRYIEEYTELAETLKEKFELLFLEIENCADLISPEDMNPDNNVACVTVTPQPCLIPEFLKIDLEATEDFSTWYNIPYSSDRFEMTLSGEPEDEYFLSLGSDTETNILLKDGYYGFYLGVRSVPNGYYAWWADKGVVEGATGWQGEMWKIINESGPTEPMFYILVQNEEPEQYKLVDGLQYLLGSDEYLHVPGDYPVGLYRFMGTVESICGSFSEEIEVSINFQIPS